MASVEGACWKHAHSWEHLISSQPKNSTISWATNWRLNQRTPLVYHSRHLFLCIQDFRIVQKLIINAVSGTDARARAPMRGTLRYMNWPTWVTLGLILHWFQAYIFFKVITKKFTENLSFDPSAWWPSARLLILQDRILKFERVFPAPEALQPTVQPDLWSVLGR